MIDVSNYCGAERDDTCNVYNHLVVMCPCHAYAILIAADGDLEISLPHLARALTPLARLGPFRQLCASVGRIDSARIAVLHDLLSHPLVTSFP